MDKEWKVGDKVVVNRKRVTTIKRITPTGLIRLSEFDGLFTSDGHQRGGSLWQGFATFEAWSEELQNMIDRKIMIQKVKGLWQVINPNLTYEEAEKLYPVLIEIEEARGAKQKAVE